MVGIVSAAGSDSVLGVEGTVSSVGALSGALLSVLKTNNAIVLPFDSADSVRALLGDGTMLVHADLLGLLTLVNTFERSSDQEAWRVLGKVIALASRGQTVLVHVVRKSISGSSGGGVEGLQSREVVLGSNPPGVQVLAEPQSLVAHEVHHVFEGGALREVGVVAVKGGIRCSAAAFSRAGDAIISSELDIAHGACYGTSYYVIINVNLSFEQLVSVNPCTASIGCVSEEVRSSVLLVESALSSALEVFHGGGSGEGCSREFALGHLVVGVGKAEICVQHHLFVRSVSTLIDQFPLVLAAVATNAKLGGPSSSNHSMVVLIVENALVSRISPMTIVARVGRGGASDCVGT